MRLSRACHLRRTKKNPPGASSPLSRLKTWQRGEHGRTTPGWCRRKHTPAARILFSLRPGNGESTAGRGLGGAAGRHSSRKYFVFAQSWQRGEHGRTTLGWCRRTILFAFLVSIGGIDTFTKQTNSSFPRPAMEKINARPTPPPASMLMRRGSTTL